MEDPIQGGTPAASADPGQGAPSATPSADAGTPQSVVPPAASADPGQGAAPVDIEERFRGVQSVVDRMQAMVLQQQQMLQQQMLQHQQQQPAAPQNPYTPGTEEYWDWKMQAYAGQVAQSTRKELMGAIETAARQQQEIQWQQSHPQVDINQVKAFAQTRGIANLDDAFTLLMLPQTQAQLITQTANQAFQSFRTPQSGAAPVRAGAPAPQQPSPQYKYTDLLAEWIKTDGKVEESWSPELRENFKRETNTRKRLGDQGIQIVRQ